MSFSSFRQAEALPHLTLDATLALVHPATRAAREYWEARRLGRDMPARRDLEHAGMRRFIANVTLVSCSGTAPCEYRVRLAGTECEAVYGAMTGRLLSDFLKPEIESRWREVLDRVRNGRAPLRVFSRLAHEGKHWLEAELFAAPLSDDGETVPMLFLCLAVTDTALKHIQDKTG